MNTVHRQEKDQFRKIFQYEKIDRIEDRFKILEVFLQTENHITAEALLLLLKAQEYEFSFEFVQDTLDFLCRYGFAQKNSFQNGQVRYEHRHLGQHHDHMICLRCQNIIEFKNNAMENLQVKIASEYGFHLFQHKMEMYGICRNCLNSAVSVMPLSEAKSGEKLKIRDFSGGVSVRMRLLTMGLRPEDEIEVITNQNSGQIVVSCGFQRYALGRGLAEKILVEAAEPGQPV
jgi:Fur family ferric uptake transcriptional regulator